MQRFLLLGRFLIARSSGVQALRRGLPLYFAIGIVATILFARQGLDAKTVVRGAAMSLALRLALLLAWLVAAFPVVRTIVTVPDNAFLRVLPVPRRQILVWLGFLVFIAELPWGVLWFRGGGALAGAAATMTAMAMHVLFLQPRRQEIDGPRLLDRAWMTALIFAWMRLGTDDVPLNSAFAMVALSALATAATVSSLRIAWQFAPEQHTPRPRGRIAGTPARALAIAYLRVLERRHGTALVRALIVIATVMGWIGIALHNDPAPPAQGTRAVLAAWAPACVLAAAVPAGPMLRSELGAEWVLAVAALPLAERRRAHVGLLATIGACVGFVASVALSFTLTWDFTSWCVLALAVTLSGALLAGSTALAMRWALRDTGHDGARAIGAVLALIAIAEAAIDCTGPRP